MDKTEVKEINGHNTSSMRTNTEKTVITEDLLIKIKGLQRKLGNKDLVIQGLSKKIIKCEKKLEETNDELLSCTQSQIRNISTLVRALNKGEEIREMETRDLTKKITELQAEIETLEGENRALKNIVFYANPETQVEIEGENRPQKKIRSEKNKVEDNGKKIMVILGGQVPEGH